MACDKLQTKSRSAACHTLRASPRPRHATPRPLRLTEAVPVKHLEPVHNSAGIAEVILRKGNGGWVRQPGQKVIDLSKPNCEMMESLRSSPPPSAMAKLFADAAPEVDRKIACNPAEV